MSAGDEDVESGGGEDFGGGDGGGGEEVIVESISPEENGALVGLRGCRAALGSHATCAHTMISYTAFLPPLLKGLGG